MGAVIKTADKCMPIMVGKAGLVGSPENFYFWVQVLARNILI